MAPVQKSFVAVEKDSHFPIQNIPFGVFSTPENTTPRVGTAIGNSVLDLAAVADAGLLDGTVENPKQVFNQPSLNLFMSLGKPSWRKVRSAIQNLLSADEPRLRDDKALLERALIPKEHVQMHLPAQVGDYTDFYCSREHATNVGIMFRGKDNALQPNWLHIPVGYHGRASSLVVSGTDVRRPVGQRLSPKDKKPIFAPSAKLDFELEVGWFVGTGNKLGDRIDISEAKDHIFGMVLVNDWSARDIQAWEYVPLGPFLGKSFATTVSPWVVTLDALEESLTAGPSQAEPQPLEYLQEKAPSAYDIALEVQIKPSGSDALERVTLSNLKYMYWSITQQLTHHTVNGCNMRTGDMCATGTISGPDKSAFGSLLELTWNGTTPVKFENGGERMFLEDGDEVNMTAYHDRGDYRIGFGDCRGKVLPCTFGH